MSVRHAYLNTRLKFKLIPLAILSAFSYSPTSFAEDESKKVIQLAPIVVTGTRVEQNSFDLPIAIDVVDQEDIQAGQLQMTLSESLIRIPGITAQNRTQSAQDPQISSRGFGSRSSFGVRGVRVYVDGIPLTMPDGQGQPGVVDLSAIKSIEVMRGPFSALYGNSSGGVIQLFTEDAPKTPEIGATVMFGSYDTKRQSLEAAGKADGVEYLLNFSNFESDGYRDNSESNKQQATAKFKFNISDVTKITTLINWFDQEAQDPLGLDRARAFNSNTRDSVVPAVDFANTSVKRDHTQIGFNIEHAFNENNKITFTPYVGNRNNAQILTTTANATTRATTSARLSEIEREFYGMDARWDNKGSLGAMPYNISLGLTYGKQTDDRLDTNTLSLGNPVNQLNRREENIASNFDQYIQGKLGITDKIDIHAGARRTKVKLEVDDDLALNGDNSGTVEYQKTTPVIGAIWKVTPTFNLYTNFGKGFETPTFVEAAFDNVSNNVASKPNLALKPSESNNYEVGAKAIIADNTLVNLALFKTTTNDEIVTALTNAGRSSFTNASKTARKGIELSIDSSFANDIGTYFSYTLLDAEFKDNFSYTTIANNVTTTRTVLAGNKIPGTYRSQIYGEISWKYQPLGFSTAIEGRYNSKVYVNDLNADTANSYAIFNVRAGFKQNLEHWSFAEYIRVENIFDKEYIGSVRVNDGNNLFFEPAADRNYLLGLSASYKF
ncbi:MULTISPECIES: TonB-dependent receptor family protein [Methylotenera]|uniref:TonB-dependent receptor family protein n=1 Tax=Methylotenera TaxID=359407 RepID=UPI000377A202|nr:MULTISPECIES: TonB-dependent receptor [Methylotenera]